MTTTPLFNLTLTLAAYTLGVVIYRKSGQLSFLQPVVTGIVFVIGAILLLDLNLKDYLQGVDILNTLLGTATVALAYPLYQNFSMIKSNAGSIAFCVVVCGTLSSGIAVFLAWLIGASKPVLLSIAPKSITTPFAIGVAESIGGYPSLAAAMVILTGIIVAIVATPTFNLMNISSPKVRGLAMGMTGHGIATTRAFELSNETGAFSALAMGLMGIYISTILPYIALLMGL